MRDAIFILFVVFLLLGLTAIRYRKQVVAMIRIHRMIKNANSPNGSNERQIRNDGATQLVNCAKCGVWVPQNTAIVFPNNLHYCSMKCLAMSKS